MAKEMTKEALLRIACERGHLKSVCDDGNGDCIECSIIEVGCDAVKELSNLQHQLKEIEQERDQFKTDVDRYRNIFKHTHCALYKDSNLSDKCAKCGLDIRNPIHDMDR